MKRLLAASALFASLAAPMVAQAAPGPSQYGTCAVAYSGVGSVGGYFPVVRMYFATNNQAQVSLDAAVCTDLIATGNWVGMSKYGEWAEGVGPRGTYRATCRVDFDFDPSTSVDVYAHDGSPTSLGFAVQDCQGFAQLQGNSVSYYN